MDSYKAEAISRMDICRCVHELKGLIGLSEELNFPILPFVENALPGLVPDYQFEVLPCSEMGNKHGETYPSKHLIKIREDVYLRASEGKGRDRLTIAHEVGHLFMHNENNIALCRLEPNERLKPYEDPEWQANAFGGELLASTYLISGMNASEVSRKCGVSMDAAKVQLRVAQQFKEVMLYGCKNRTH